jgi:crotonobetainyl-CoA:carnitine CoA-transferase CaiB-like acyl-CoA transferase
MEGTEPVMAPVPGIGEHTDDILVELGYDEDAVSTLRSSSAV